MDAIKKKMSNLRDKLDAAEERSRKAELDLMSTNQKADEVRDLVFGSDSYLYVCFLSCHLVCLYTGLPLFVGRPKSTELDFELTNVTFFR